MRETLKSYFGYSQFRPMQESVIRHILAGKDCLVLMPTGGGKSICYQIPALMMEGTAIVVSPLISLMKDQVESLRANGISAAALNSNASEAENRLTSERARQGEYRLLYVSPERLLSEMEYGILRPDADGHSEGQMKISLFAIECSSQVKLLLSQIFFYIFILYRRNAVVYLLHLFSYHVNGSNLMMLR